MSIEFVQDALDEDQARRGPWLEVETDNPAELSNRILEAGLPRMEYSGNDYFYFQAPGGQVMRLAQAEPS